MLRRHSLLRTAHRVACQQHQQRQHFPTTPLCSRRHIFTASRPLLDVKQVEKAFGQKSWKTFTTKITNWEKNLNLADWNNLNRTLVACGIDPLKTPAMATALLEHFRELPFKSLKLPPVDGCRSDFYNRADSLEVASDYIESVITVTDAGYHSTDQNTGQKVEKFTLLGSSGMKGIGKTEFLHQIAHRCLPQIGTKLKRKIRPLYVSFNGSKKANATVFGNFYNHHLKPKTLLGSLCSEAAAHVLLRNCGAQLLVSTAVSLENAVERLRRSSNLGRKGVLVLLIDEVGELGDDVAMLTIKALMSEVDRQQGKLVCLFAHISQEVLNTGAKMSGRQVKPLALPSLSINVWKKADVLMKGSKLPLYGSAKKNPGLHQLFLSLSGHPRSIFDGIPAAVNANPTLLRSPNAAALSNARQKIIEVSKLNDTTSTYVGNTILTWLANHNVNEQQLICDGLLHQVQTHSDVKFLFPLKVHEWAKHLAKSDSLAHHLNQLFDHDSMAGHGREKLAEHVMFHFEAAKRIALAKHKKTVTLEVYYDVTMMDPSLKNRQVKITVPRSPVHVFEADSFAKQNMPKVVDSLKAGYIVVSKKPTEVGVEYCVPFFDSKTKALLVACVQCKFVNKQMNRSSIRSKMKQATRYFNANGIEFFPVVYTSVDQKSVRKRTCQNGVYFLEHDLFRFTSRVGILRLHCTKLGGVLRKKYPFLSSANSSS